MARVEGWERSAHIDRQAAHGRWVAPILIWAEASRNDPAFTQRHLQKEHRGVAFACADLIFSLRARYKFS
jgi:hypothetical protein